MILAVLGHISERNLAKQKNESIMEKDYSNITRIEGYPFDVSGLSNKVKKWVNDYIKDGKRFYQLEENVRKEFEENGQKPDSLMLLLSWAIYRMVEEGVHIDDLVEDSKEAAKWLKTYLSHAPADPSDELMEFECELDEQLQRAMEFEDML